MGANFCASNTMFDMQKITTSHVRGIQFHFICLWAGVRAKDSNSSFAMWVANANDKRKYKHTGKTQGQANTHAFVRQNCWSHLKKKNIFFCCSHSLSPSPSIEWVCVCDQNTRTTHCGFGRAQWQQRGVRQHLLDLSGAMRINTIDE